MKKKEEQHPPAVYKTVEAIIATLASINKGTDLGLARTMWTVMSGALLSSRGALIPALASVGFNEQEVMHSWAASRRGKWNINEMLSAWSNYSQTNKLWTANSYHKKN
ncbi:MAG: hypothetical protein ACKO19_02425 [Betaproteobacteria bacterium]|jgi:hypothetical protein